MKLVDSNILLYAVHEEAVHHPVARRWLDRTLSSNETVLMPWISLIAFLRISTRPDIYPDPLPIEAAIANVEAWLEVPSVITGEPDTRHAQRLGVLLRATGVGGNLVNDAHLAALALQYDATVVSYDNDFNRFPGVRWQQPN